MMRRQNRTSALTLIELLIAVVIISIMVAATIKAITITRALTARSQSLTRLMLRAHSEIEKRKSLSFDQLTTGTTVLTGFEDSRTTGAVTLARLPGSDGIRITVELVGHTHRGAEPVRLTALRFPQDGGEK